ncbi:MAG TPA: hypothetical protein VF475_12260 [Sphingobium sp.]
MSRAVNLTAASDAVMALCEQHKIGISTIEALDSGGTRVVLDTMGQADELRRRMKTQVINGPVVRSGLFIARTPTPFI